MQAVVWVGVATSRPPREHEMRRVIVDVPVIDFEFGVAEREAEQTAIAMAMADPNVVMAVSSQIDKIIEI